MYLLDTNVISELRKAASGKADKNVVDWANSISATRLFLSVITVLELETGILLVEKRDQTQGAVLRSWLNAHVLPAFSDRILVVDTAVAQCCSTVLFQTTCARLSVRSRCSYSGYSPGS